MVSWSQNCLVDALYELGHIYIRYVFSHKVYKLTKGIPIRHSHSLWQGTPARQGKMVSQPSKCNIFNDIDIHF